ncbi:hypothetical protein [Phycicoccus flavus]|uniref:Uncharacterized protein n=1 Tax=Phycicoccus flavus TaxID=2502783 RepID=A0A8T6R556_9MICO|nr:hypothetical protein [Phycicoccus flavus]NHA69609.1 hypothetical protein [Phycicoccus flavus]
MRLVSAVLGFVLRKLGLLAVTVLAMFLVYLLVQVLAPPLRQAVADRGRLDRVAAERATLEADLAELRREAEAGRQETVGRLETQVGAEIDRTRDDITRTQETVAAARTTAQDVCGRLGWAVDALSPGTPCEDAKNAVRATEESLATLETNLTRAQEDAAVIADPDLTTEEKLQRLGAGGDPVLQREIDNTESALNQKRAEEDSLLAARRSGAGYVVDQWSRSWRWLLAIGVLVLLMPPLLRTVSYFVLMPVVRRLQRPVALAAGTEQATTDLRTSPAERTLTVDLDDGEVLSARSEHVRPVQGRVRSRLLYDWGSPFISFAAGLYGLSRVTGEDGVVTSATLATPDDPSAYLMRIDFEDHPGLVMRPRHVVGVVGSPRLETRWRWGIQALARWQVRYVLFAGTGSLVVQGIGDVVATDPRGGSVRMEQNLVMGFDSRLVVTVDRTEVFWPYLWGRTPLVDDRFVGGEPLFWQKSTDQGSRNPIARTFDALFSAVGKVLGF